MARVYLGIGSNIERERYISAGLDALSALLGELELSPVYDSAAVGFDGQPFLNLVARAETSLALQALAAELRRIEHAHGRPTDAPRLAPRQLDIDILTYDGLVGEHAGIRLPRPEILESAFVLLPLSELAPEARHPADGRSYAELWQAFDCGAQQLTRVDFRWRGRAISRA